MASSSVFLADLKAGCYSNTAEVPLLRLKEARNVKKGGLHKENVTPASHHRVLLALSTQPFDSPLLLYVSKTVKLSTRRYLFLFLIFCFWI